MQPSTAGAPPSQGQISKFLASIGQVSLYDQESQCFKVICPSCKEADPNVASPTAKLSINTGTYFCHQCHEKGNWNDFTSKTKVINVVSLPDLSTNLGHASSSPDLVKYSYIPLRENLSALTRLHKSKPKTKCIDLATLEEFEVSLSYLRTDESDEALSRSNHPLFLVFPRTSHMYHSNDSEQHSHWVQIKASVLPDQGHTVYQPTAINLAGLFGSHLIKPHHKTLVLTQSEWDAMAIYQSTNLPAVSLPRDIFQIPPESLILFSQFDKIYIWMDNTIQGQNASIQFARKLGLNRCQLIKPTEHDQNPPFNALDAVYKKLNIQEWLDRSQPYTHQNILGFSALRDSVFMEVMNSEQAKGVPSNDFPALSQIIKGLRPGELTIFSGPTGSGKTTFLSQISLDYCKSGVSTLWGSFEINNVRLVKKMLYQYAGFSLQGDFEQYKEWAEKFNTLPLYFLKFFGTTPIHRVIEAMQHAVEAYDVQHFIIDNLQFMTSGLGKGFEKWDIQDNALTQFRQFATNYNVHVTLVVHPKKDDRGFLDINSVFGSAKVTQEADNVIFIQNGPNKLRFIDVKKNRFDGTVGMVPLKFDPESNRVSLLILPLYCILTKFIRFCS